MAKYTLKLWFFCAINFAFNTHSIGQVQEQQVVFPTQSVHSIDGIGWASSIGNNFITGSSFWVYINPNLEAVVARKSADGTITTKVIMQNVQNNNNHAEFSLGVDNEGYIHVMGGHHNSSPQYYVSTNPDDISSFEFKGNDLANGGLQGKEITYQSFKRSNKGTLFVTYRSNVVGGSVTGHRSIALGRYDTKTKKWTMIGGKNYQVVTTTSCTPTTGDQTGLTAFVWNNSGVGDMRPADGKCFSHAHYQGYQMSIKFDQNNRMHVSYNMADSINVDYASQDVSKFMTHLFYAYSPDEGSTWYKANGNQITTFPITKATGDLVHKSIPPGYVYPATTTTPTMQNSCSTILDKDGLPIIVQFDYITNSTLMFKWSGTSWVNQTSLTNRSDRFYTDLSKKIIYNFGSSQQFQMSDDNMATFKNNVTMVYPAAWYVVVDDFYLTKTRNVMYYARNETAGNATITNMVVSSPDGFAPAAPAGLFSSEIAQNRITLNWTPSPELDVCRYDVYRNGILVGSTGSSYYSISGLSPSTSYTFTVKAVDGSNNVSNNSTALNVGTLAPVPDTQAPTAPTGLAASSVTHNSLTLTWIASTDNVGVVSYEVFKDGVSLGTSTTTTMNISGLTNSTAYSMTVKANDAVNNQSAASTALLVTTSSPPDVQAPTVPTALSSGSITHTSFTLSWTASTDDKGVAAYEVFKDGASIGTSTTTSMNITGLSPVTAYSMTVRAKDAASNFSAKSSALTVTTIADPVMLVMKPHNLLTPNGDGHNDKWMVEGMPTTGSHQAKVYDPTGRLVFSSNNYQNDWDGTYKGIVLANGAYFYTITSEGKTVKGFITILR